MIPAHDSPVAAMAFNSAGTKLSTASEKASLKISKLSFFFFFPKFFIFNLADKNIANQTRI